MRGPEKTKPHAGGRGASGGANGREAKGKAKHSPQDFAASCLLLATAIAGARGIVSRMALATDWPPHGLVEAADNLDQAGEHLARIVSGEAGHDPE